jgi:DNA-binding LacI/PurR family transcriptional regulator
LPTVQQLRRELNVSITTLDSALKQLESQNVIFRKQGSGIFVSPRLHQKCVGLVCEPAFFSAGMSPFWQQMIESARSRASLGGEAFRFYLAMRSMDGASPLHDDLIEDIAAQRTDGVLFLGNNEEAQEWLKQHRVPTVVFAGRGDYRVEIDLEQLIALAGRYLFERGCQRPALLSHWETSVDPAYEPEDSSKIKFFRDFLNSAGLTYYPHLIWDANALGDRVPSVPDTHQEQGYQAVMHLFDGSQPAPDGILSTDDMMTRGVLAGLRKLGLKSGKDVQIVTHINRGSKVLKGEDENIAFVEVDPAEIVAKMFTQLELLMDNNDSVEACAVVEAHFQD